MSAYSYYLILSNIIERRASNDLIDISNLILTNFELKKMRNTHTHTVPCPSACQLQFKPVVFQLRPGGVLEKQGEKWGPIKVSLQAQSVCQVASNI